jgi:hypothetical protein
MLLQVEIFKKWKSDMQINLLYCTIDLLCFVYFVSGSPFCQEKIQIVTTLVNTEEIVSSAGLGYFNWIQSEAVSSLSLAAFTQVDKFGSY